MPRLWYAPGCLLSSSIRMPLNLMCREREEDLSLSAATCLTAPRFGTCTVLHMHSVLCCACMCTVHAQWQLHVACACTTEVGRAARRASAPSGRPRRAAPMGKHSKNSNDRAFFSYHERKAASYGRLSSAMLGGHNTADGNHQSHGWGTMQRTLDGDAMKEIDACSLSLQACVHPVVTENGILYDKQVIVEYILSRKKVIPPPPPQAPVAPTPQPSPLVLSSHSPPSNADQPAAPDDATPRVPHQELERELHAWEAQEAGAAADAASEEQEAQQVRIDEFVAQQEGLSYARPARTRPYHHTARPCPKP